MLRTLGGALEDHPPNPGPGTSASVGTKSASGAWNSWSPALTALPSRRMCSHISFSGFSYIFWLGSKATQHSFSFISLTISVSAVLTEECPISERSLARYLVTPLPAKSSLEMHTQEVTAFVDRSRDGDTIATVQHWSHCRAQAYRAARAAEPRKEQVPGSFQTSSQPFFSRWDKGLRRVMVSSAGPSCGFILSSCLYKSLQIFSMTTQDVTTPFSIG